MVSGSKSLGLGKWQGGGMDSASPKTALCPHYHQLQPGSCHQKEQRETLSHTPPVTENVRDLKRVAGAGWSREGSWA